MTSWERIFDGAFEMKFELGEIDVTISGELAVLVVEENLTQRGYDGVSRSRVIATNVFQRVGDGWRMIIHHGSPVIQPPDPSEPPLQ